MSCRDCKWYKPGIYERGSCECRPALPFWAETIWDGYGYSSRQPVDVEDGIGCECFEEAATDG